MTRHHDNLATPRDACPDCHATTELEPGPPGVWLLTIRHDTTCPALRALTERTTDR